MTKSRNGGEWTEARYRTFVTSALRGASKRWPPKYDTLRRSYVDTRVNEATGRMAKHYRCAECNGLFPAKSVAVDHKDPVVNPKTGFVSWDEYIERLFCEADNLQTLCSTCHNIKTKEEREEAKLWKQQQTNIQGQKTRKKGS